MWLFHSKRGVTLSFFIEKRIVDFKDQKILHRGYPYSKNAISSWEKYLFYIKKSSQFCRVGAGRFPESVRPCSTGR